MFIGRDDYAPDDADRLSWSPAHDGTIFWTGDMLSSVTCSVSSGIPLAIMDNVAALRSVAELSFVASSKSLYRVVVDFGSFKSTSHQCRLVVGIASNGLCAFKTPGSPWHCMINATTFPTAILRRLNLTSVQVPTFKDFAEPISDTSIGVFLQRMAHSALLDWRSSVYIPLWFALPDGGVLVGFLLDKKTTTTTTTTVTFERSGICDICALVTKKRADKKAISPDSTVPVVLWTGTLSSETATGTLSSETATFYFLTDQYPEMPGSIFRVSGPGGSVSKVVEAKKGGAVLVPHIASTKIAAAIRESVSFLKSV